MFVITNVLFLLSNCAGQQVPSAKDAMDIALEIFNYYNIMFNQCLQTSMSNQRFFVDNLHNYINAFSMTTMGYAPLITENRKFFANMINTAAFKNVLEKDMTTLQRNFVEKMKFCNRSIIDKENLKQYYDREVDQTKL